MSRKRKIILVLAGVAAVAAAVFFVVRRNDDASALVRFSGNIEVVDVPLSFKTAGRLQARLVDEGDPVRRGQVVARLDTRDQERLVARAEADFHYAEAVLEELLAGSRRQQIEAARAEAQRARAALSAAAAQLALARADEARYAALVKEGGVSRRDYEAYRTRLETAAGAEAEARARLESARAQLDLVTEGPRQETIAAAQARALAAAEAVKLARQQLADMELQSPLDAVVLYKAAEPGAFLGPGTPVVVIGDLARPWLRGYVNGVDLGRIRLGQKVRVTVDAFPDRPVEGTLSFIAGEAEFTPKTVQTEEERVRLMYRVKVDLPNPDGVLKPGMPADAEIVLDD
ncbi:MAG: efflux RND transporter periplasmic adaptor subunit [Deltaproteobacteria bacterium]|nr:efflux RND transporter periplasmic adaptor subunit [Deltaproteobacteria bacterium]